MSLPFLNLIENAGGLSRQLENYHLDISDHQTYTKDNKRRYR